MPLPPSIQLTLDVTPTSLPGQQPWLGQGLRIVLRTLNADTQAPIAATGVQIAVREPGAAVRVLYGADQLEADGTGQWVLQLAASAAGRWRIRGECAGPSPAAQERVVDVRGSQVVVEYPPAEQIVTREGELLTTPDGRSISAQRVDRLPAAGPVQAGDAMLVVRSGVAYAQTVAELLEEAGDAGAAAGGAAGATAGQAAGATAGQAAGATAGQASGATAGQTAGASAGAAAGEAAGAAALASHAAAANPHSQYALLSGAAFSGTVTLPADPVAAADAVRKQWIDAAEHRVFHVRRYGALGNGVNQTSAVQAAINAAEAAGGGVVAFAQGTYLVGDLVIDADNVVLQGDGRGTQLVKTTASSALLTVSHPTPSATNQLRGFQARNIRFQHQSGTTPEGAVGINMVRTITSRLVDCDIRHFHTGLMLNGAVGTHLDNVSMTAGSTFGATTTREGSSLIRFKNFQNTNETVGLVIDNSLFQAETLTVDGARVPLVAAAMWIEGCDTVMISNSHISGARDNVLLRTTEANAKITGLTFSNCYAEGYQTSGGALETIASLTNFNISGCAATPTIEHISWSGGLLSNVREDCIRIAENNARSIAFTGIAVQAFGNWFANITSTSPNTRVSLVGCTGTRFAVAGGTTRGGVRVAGAAVVSVSGGALSGPATLASGDRGVGLLAEDTARIIRSGLVLANWTTDTTRATGARILHAQGPLHVGDAPNPVEIRAGAAGLPAYVGVNLETAEDNRGLVLGIRNAGNIQLQTPDFTATGGNVRGGRAVDFSTTRALATQVASGTRAFLFPSVNGTASGSMSIGAGEAVVASGAYSLAQGHSSTADADYAWATGFHAQARGLFGAEARASGFISKTGDAQARRVLLRGTATGGARVLTANNAAAAANNILVLPDNTTAHVRAYVVARQTAGSAGTVGDSAIYELVAMVQRGAGAATTTVSAALTSISAAAADAAGWTCQITADTTLGGVAVTLTVQANKTVVGVAQIEAVEFVA